MHNLHKRKSRISAQAAQTSKRVKNRGNLAAHRVLPAVVACTRVHLHVHALTRARFPLSRVSFAAVSPPRGGILSDNDNSHGAAVSREREREVLSSGRSALRSIGLERAAVPSCVSRDTKFHSISLLSRRERPRDWFRETRASPVENSRSPESGLASGKASRVKINTSTVCVLRAPRPRRSLTNITHIRGFHLRFLQPPSRLSTIRRNLCGAMAAIKWLFGEFTKARRSRRNEHVREKTRVQLQPA